MSDGLREVIERLSMDERTAAEQTNVLDRLEPSRRRLVVGRLMAVDRFLRSDRTAVDAQSAADEIGTGVRNLYRLIARMEEVGPVGGLVPGYRAPVPAADRPQEQHAMVQGWLRAFLRTPAIPSRTRVEGYVQGRVDAYNEANPKRPDIEPPGPVALAAMIDALKREQALAAGAIAGERIVIDQVVLSPSVHAGAGKLSVAATFVIDQTTAIILGVGISALPDVHGDGLGGALHDLKQRARSLAEAGLGFTPLADLEWVVPPGLLGFADYASEAAPDVRGLGVSRKGLHMTIVAEGRRRHAVRIVGILGNALGRLRFLTRAPLDPEETNDGSPPGVQEHREDAADDAPDDPPPENGTERIESVHAALFAGTDRWNAARIRLLQPDAEPESVTAAADLHRALDSIFSPVMAASAACLERPRHW
jgi:hypothetical protein